MPHLCRGEITGPVQVRDGSSGVAARRANAGSATLQRVSAGGAACVCAGARWIVWCGWCRARR